MRRKSFVSTACKFLIEQQNNFFEKSFAETLAETLRKVQIIGNIIVFVRNAIYKVSSTISSPTNLSLNYNLKKHSC